MRPEQEARRRQLASIANTLPGVWEREDTGTEVSTYLNYGELYKLAGYSTPKLVWNPALFPSAPLARDALKGMG